MIKKLFLPLTLLCFSTIFAQGYNYGSYSQYPYEQPMNSSYSNTQTKNKPTVITVNTKNRPFFSALKAVLGTATGIIITVLVGYVCFMGYHFSGLANQQWLSSSFGKFIDSAASLTGKFSGKPTKMKNNNKNNIKYMYNNQHRMNSQNGISNDNIKQ